MFPAAEIAAALSGAFDGGLVAVPGAVVFAGRERSVFLPNAEQALQLQALRFFTNSPLRRMAGAVVLRVWRVTGLNARSAKLELPAQWRDEFDADLGAAALYAGSPGPLQKATLLLPPRRRGGAFHLVKLALKPSADVSIAREADCLAKLAETGEAIRRHVPSLMAQGSFPSGRRYLVTTAHAGRRGRWTLCDEYIAFLHAVGQATREDLVWEQGHAILHTRQQLRALGGEAMTPRSQSALWEALDSADAQLLGKRIPHTLMHGDFTRFNISESSSGFVVYDWEYSRPGCNPIADALHYRLSQERPGGAVSAMRSALTDARRFANAALESWHPTQEDISALALHALVDTISFYAVTDGYLNTDSRLMRRYVELIESKRSWMRM